MGDELTLVMRSGWDSNPRETCLNNCPCRGDIPVQSATLPPLHLTLYGPFVPCRVRAIYAKNLFGWLNRLGFIVQRKS